MGTRVVTSQTINGRAVTKIDEFGDIVIYQVDDTGDSAELYICNNKGEVLRQMEITADCSQNTGFIDRIEFYL